VRYRDRTTGSSNSAVCVMVCKPRTCIASTATATMLPPPLLLLTGGSY